jgi:flagellar basal-body rod modification protein FlgD
MSVPPTSSVGDLSAGLAAGGLDTESLMKIILTQLTYQDPLKPVDNFEFVSQLAQFMSLEQSRETGSKLDNLLGVQAATQSMGLLGRTVDVQTDTALVSGTVKSISFKGDQPQLTITSSTGDVLLTDATVSQVVQVR